MVGKNYEKEIFNNRLLNSSQKNEDLEFIGDQRQERVAKFFSPDRNYERKVFAKEKRQSQVNNSTPKITKMNNFDSPLILAHKKCCIKPINITDTPKIQFSEEESPEKPFYDKPFTPKHPIGKSQRNSKSRINNKTKKQQLFSIFFFQNFFAFL